MNIVFLFNIFIVRENDEIVLFKNYYGYKCSDLK